jgi:hypothetical protein
MNALGSTDICILASASVLLPDHREREKFGLGPLFHLAPEAASEVHSCTERDEIRTSWISEPHSQNDGCALPNCENPNNDELLGTRAVAKGGIPPNGGDEPGLSDYRIRRLAGWYLDRAEGERQRTGTIRQSELDEALRMVLAEDGGLPEFIAVEFERVMRAVFGN